MSWLNNDKKLSSEFQSLLSDAFNDEYNSKSITSPSQKFKSHKKKSLTDYKSAVVFDNITEEDLLESDDDLNDF